MHEHKLKVENDFQGMKILVVQIFSYKEGVIVIVDLELIFS